MFYILQLLTNLTKLAIFITKSFFKFYILIKYLFLILIKKKLSNEKSLFYGCFFLELGFYRHSKKILGKISKRSKCYKYAQFYLGATHTII